jgi:hypothetical protein
LTLPPQSETVGQTTNRVGGKMNIGKWAISGGLMSAVLIGAFSFPAVAQTQTAPKGAQIAQDLTPEDLAARPSEARPPVVVRRPRRVRIYPRYEAEGGPDVYPRYNPGPNAVRVCNASYVQEYRPSGTVIVPHMTCVWR